MAGACHLVAIETPALFLNQLSNHPGNGVVKLLVMAASCLSSPRWWVCLAHVCRVAITYAFLWLISEGTPSQVGGGNPLPRLMSFHLNFTPKLESKPSETGDMLPLDRFEKRIAQSEG